MNKQEIISGIEKVRQMLPKTAAEAASPRQINSYYICDNISVVFHGKGQTRDALREFICRKIEYRFGVEWFLDLPDCDIKERNEEDYAIAYKFRMSILDDLIEAVNSDTINSNEDHDEDCVEI